jgi:hypothetical protein
MKNGEVVYFDADQKQSEAMATAIILDSLK